MFIRVWRVGAQDRALQPENEVFLARACGLRRNSFEAASFHFQDTAEMRSCTTPPRQLLVGLRDNNFAPFDSFACTLVGKASYSSPAKLDLFFYAHTICDRAITSPSCGLFLSFIIFLTHFLLFTTFFILLHKCRWSADSTACVRSEASTDKRKELFATASGTPRDRC